MNFLNLNFVRVPFFNVSLGFGGDVKWCQAGIWLGRNDNFGLWK